MVRYATLTHPTGSKTQNRPYMTDPHLASPTVKFVDDYCQCYQVIFLEVRRFEAFKKLWRIYA
jgi:hypothetical protein